MSQLTWGVFGSRIKKLQIPSPEAEILEGVPWGAYQDWFTPAFWKERAWKHSEDQGYLPQCFGRTLAEEMAFCMLGGYGIPAEVGTAAFARLRDSGILDGTFTPDELKLLLDKPLVVGGRSIRYRFARSKSLSIAAAINSLAKLIPSDNDLSLRSDLMALPGIGPKTASWIVRNWRYSDEVAIIDVHIHRRCVQAGVFSSLSRPDKDYLRLERRFLEFANALGVRPSVLDNLMWDYSRRLDRFDAS